MYLVMLENKRRSQIIICYLAKYRYVITFQPFLNVIFRLTVQKECHFYTRESIKEIQ